MKHRVLGRTGVEVSEVGLGTQQLGSADCGKVDESTAHTILATAVDPGVNFFDTAATGGA